MNPSLINQIFTPEFIQDFDSTDKELEQAQRHLDSLRTEIKNFNHKLPQIDEIDASINELVRSYNDCTSHVPYSHHEAANTGKEVVQLLQKLEGNPPNDVEFQRKFREVKLEKHRALLRRVEHLDRTSDNPVTAMPNLFNERRESLTRESRAKKSKPDDTDMMLEGISTIFATHPQQGQQAQQQSSTNIMETSTHSLSGTFNQSLNLTQLGPTLSQTSSGISLQASSRTRHDTITNDERGVGGMNEDEVNLNHLYGNVS